MNRILSRLVLGAGALALCGYCAVPTKASAAEPTPDAAFNDVIVSDNAAASIQLVDGRRHFHRFGHRGFRRGHGFGFSLHLGRGYGYRPYSYYPRSYGGYGGYGYGGYGGYGGYSYGGYGGFGGYGGYDYCY